MDVRLLSPVADPDPAARTTPFAEDLVQDLQLDVLLDAMAGGDAFLREVARITLLSPVPDPETIVHRQRAFDDCVRNAEGVEELYGIAVDALELRHGVFMLPVRGHPELQLSYAVKMLTELATRLERLRTACAAMREGFSSPAFRSLFSMVARELDEGYLSDLRRTLHELAFAGGLLVSAGIGPGGEVVAQVPRRGKDENRHLFDRTPLKRPLHSFTLPDRDEAGANALAELRDRSLDDIANAASQSVDHVLGFFRALRAELGFYTACRRLTDRLAGAGCPVCVPGPRTSSPLRARGLYDPCLALRTDAAPVGNDVEMPSQRLLLVTGANRGGNTTCCV